MNLVLSITLHLVCGYDYIINGKLCFNSINCDFESGVSFLQNNIAQIKSNSFTIQFPVYNHIFYQTNQMYAYNHDVLMVNNGYYCSNRLGCCQGPNCYTLNWNHTILNKYVLTQVISTTNQYMYTIFKLDNINFWFNISGSPIDYIDYAYDIMMIN